MAEIQDSSHARGIIDLQTANDASKGLGARYAPDDALIQTDQVDAFCLECKTQLAAVYEGERGFDEARAARKLLFKGLAPFGTQLANTLKSSKATDRTVAEARTLVQKIRGERATEPPRSGSDTPADEIARQVSVAQTSYDNRVEHLRKLVSLAKGMGAAYKAAADSHKLPALEAKLSALESANRAAKTAGIAYTTALTGRDRLLYHPQTGAPARMEAIRTWYESAFGARSAERKLLNGLRVQDLSSRHLAAV